MSTSNKKNVCDTCVLLVDYTDITITELGRFKPNPQILWDMQGAEAVTCYNFATREEQQQHYWELLSPAQLDYMMEWMYSEIGRASCRERV